MKMKKIMFYDTFIRLWHETMPNLKFQLPESDLCEVCEIFKKQIQISKNDNKSFEKSKKQYDIISFIRSLPAGRGQ